MDCGHLYVVATPIGNLEDMTPRAVRTLRECALIAAEDTRHSRKLLDHFGIATALISYHEHNEADRAAELVALLQSGKDVALVTDAGTPAISDPGYRVVRACHEAAIPVLTIPGPSAAAAALSVSGLPSDRFVFHGFLPRKASAIAAVLAEAAQFPATHVFYESPNRVEAAVAAIAERFPERDCRLSRELTKLHEETLAGTATELLDRVRATPPRGECVLLLHIPRGEPAAIPEAADLRRLVREAMDGRGLSRRDAVRAVAEDMGLPRNAVYAAAVEAEAE